MRIVVTGGAGFIGSHAVEALVRSGHDVLVVDDLSTGTLANLANVRDLFTFTKRDIRDRAACLQTVSDWRTEAVVHLAAVVSPPQSIAEPELAHDVNLNGTFNVLEAARRSGVRRFIFASSAAVYGPWPSLPSRENDPVDPVSPYAAQKIAGEYMARVYRTVWGVQTVCLRFFNVFGERQPAGSAYSGVISAFVAALRAGGRGVIHGDGTQSRDFIYVADVARAVVRATVGEDPGVGPFNIGRGESLRIRELYRLIARRLGAADEPRFDVERPGDVHDSRAQIERMRDGLGIVAEMDVDRALDSLLRS